MRQIDFLDMGVQRARDEPCLVGPDLRLSFGEVQALTHRIARALQAEGLRSAGTLSPNDPRGFLALLGVFRAEALSMALNARASHADNLAHLRFGEAEALFYHSSLEAPARALRDAQPTIRRCICVDRDGDLGPGLDAWIADFPAQPPALAPEDPLRVYRITLTGGTTGGPKAVQHAHLQAQVNTMAFLSVLRYEQAPRYLMAAPMTHAAGLVSFHALALGGSVHFLPRGDAASILAAIERDAITTTVMPPTLLYDLLAQPRVGDARTGSLRYLLVGTAPVSADKLREAVRVLGPAVGQIYGQSECPMLTYLSPDEVAQAVADPAQAGRLLSCGRPLPGTVLGVMDDAGRLLPDGDRGELVVRSNQRMRGYLGQPQATQEVGAHGWHHTADLGWRDAQGYYYIVDRKRDLIISGGFNVYPSEVEQVLWSHPAVQDCAVIGVPDARWGEAVKAIVQLKPGQAATEDELIALCKSAVGSVKAPKSVEFRQTLPKSPVGKVLKRELRAPYWAATDRTV